MTKFNFTAELLAVAVSKIDCGKSPGFDELTIEHVVHSHPIIYSLYPLLFNVMLKHSYVPMDFGLGITIPIPKDNYGRGSNAIDNFRGITFKFNYKQSV